MFFISFSAHAFGNNFLLNHNSSDCIFAQSRNSETARIELNRNNDSISLCACAFERVLENISSCGNQNSSNAKLNNNSKKLNLAFNSIKTKSNFTNFQNEILNNKTTNYTRAP